MGPASTCGRVDALCGAEGGAACAVPAGRAACAVSEGGAGRTGGGERGLMLGRSAEDHDQVGHVLPDHRRDHRPGPEQKKRSSPRFPVNGVGVGVSHQAHRKVQCALIRYWVLTVQGYLARHRKGKAVSWEEEAVEAQQKGGALRTASPGA